MPPLSDTLIILSKPLDSATMRAVKHCLMETDSSVLVHQKDGQTRVLLVKFDPRNVSPSQLLTTVRLAGFEATMASG